MTQEFESMTVAVVRVIESMPDGQVFYGNELHEAVARIYPPAKKMYTDSLLRMMRKRCRDIVKILDHNHSLYQKIGYQRTA